MSFLLINKFQHRVIAIQRLNVVYDILFNCLCTFNVSELIVDFNQRVYFIRKLNRFQSFLNIIYFIYLASYDVRRLNQRELINSRRFYINLMIYITSIFFKTNFLFFLLIITQNYFNNKPPLMILHSINIEEKIDSIGNVRVVESIFDN